MGPDDRVRRRVRSAKRGRPEDAIHFEVVRALRGAPTRLVFFHCPNESDVAVQYRNTLRRRGVSAGVPDLLIVTPPPCGGYVGAALELKAPGGTLRDTQRQWLTDLALARWAVACVYGLDEALAQLRAWGYPV